MNNSKFIVENLKMSPEKVDRKPFLRQEEQKLIEILTSLQKVAASKEWSSLKNHVFDGLVETLTRDLNNEAKVEKPDALKLNRLAGQLKWAEKFSDLTKLEAVFRMELTNIRKLLYGKSEETPGL